MPLFELSCDIGEALNTAEQQIEDALWPLLDAANVACGGHAGDDASMRHAVAMAKQHAVVLGAHPSYPDRENFGRKTMAIDPADLEASLVSQLTALWNIAAEAGLRLDRVKVHGALYNDAHRDIELARVIIGSMLKVDRAMKVVVAPRSAVERVANDEGVTAIREGFADRGYRRDGSLVPRTEPGALLLDIEEAVAQARMLAFRGRVRSIDGEEIFVPFDTICIHGDMERAVERAQAVRAALRWERA
jgi:5-oxoprolinase (ATP-hydrolysing) subunit A